MSKTFAAYLDESEKGRFLAVGGFFCSLESTRQVVKRWRGLKQGYRLPATQEVKWSASPDLLAILKNEAKQFYDDVVAAISSIDEIRCFVSVHREVRNLRWWKRNVSAKASVRDFYCEAFRYFVQRVQSRAAEESWRHVAIICDTPELGRAPERPLSGTKIRRGRNAVYETYRQFQEKGGLGVKDGKEYPPLDDSVFHPAVLVSDATYHDMLQIADCIVGCTLDWVAAVAAGEETTRGEVARFVHLSGRFLKTEYGRIFGEGLVLWPSDEELWQKLQASLREPAKDCALGSGRWNTHPPRGASRI